MDQITQVILVLVYVVLVLPVLFISNRLGIQDFLFNHREPAPDPLITGWIAIGLFWLIIGGFLRWVWRKRKESVLARIFFWLFALVVVIGIGLIIYVRIMVTYFR